jgi:hypothetical protein
MDRRADRWLAVLGLGVTEVLHCRSTPLGCGQDVHGVGALVDVAERGAVALPDLTADGIGALAPPNGGVPATHRLVDQSGV